MFNNDPRSEFIATTLNDLEVKRQTLLNAGLQTQGEVELYHDIQFMIENMLVQQELLDAGKLDETYTY